MRSDLEQALKGWLLDEDPKEFDGLDERSRQVYRRLVRRSLTRGVQVSLPVTQHLMGEEELDRWIVRWMEEAPPTTRLYWRLPLEFAQWFREEDDLPHPAAAELVHWEAVRLDARNAPSWEGPAPEFSEPAPDRTVVLDPSARLGIYHHPVYRLKKSSEKWPEPTEAPSFVLSNRRDERVRWRVLAPVTAQLLAQLAEGKTLEEGQAVLEQIYDGFDMAPSIDALQKLCDEKAIRGFATPDNV